MRLLNEAKALLLIAIIALLGLILLYFKDEDTLYPLDEVLVKDILDIEEKVGSPIDFKVLISVSKVRVYVINRSQKDLSIKYMALVSKDLKNRCILKPNKTTLKPFERVSVDRLCNEDYHYLHFVDQNENNFMYSK